MSASPDDVGGEMARSIDSIVERAPAEERASRLREMIAFESAVLEEAERRLSSLSEEARLAAERTNVDVLRACVLELERMLARWEASS
jgi:hypothetical protein